MWIATVNNIDWPSRPDLTPAQQRGELVSIMDRAVELKLNVLIFQVRPGCDALYASKLEPWSEYLTGAMGKAPEPLWDPLAFAITEAHRRGLELHAWFNPYRARHAAAKSPVSADHISKTRPHLVKVYGKFLWLDPGEKEVQEHSLAVVMDVVRRYDIDGVHFDDYFYPYKEKNPDGSDVDFPDAASYKKYTAAGGKLGKEDWRRENVDQFIQKVYQSIKAKKPWVKFGISPFGIWRPGFPSQIKGMDQYEKLYADARKWIQNGWCDYFAPQLYWAIEPPDQSFPVLLDWWNQQNLKLRHVVPGLNSANVEAKWQPSEIENQIEIARKRAAGHIHWNATSLMRSPKFRESLKSTVYESPALVPATPWLSKEAAPAPKPVFEAPDLRWRTAQGESVALWVFQYRAGRKWTTKILPGKNRSAEIPSQAEVVSLTAINRFGTASKPAVFEKKQKQ